MNKTCDTCFYEDDVKSPACIKCINCCNYIKGTNVSEIFTDRKGRILSLEGGLTHEQTKV